MHRRKLREHMFRMVYFLNYYPEEEWEKQCAFYLDELTAQPAGSADHPSEQDLEELSSRPVSLMKKAGELDEKINAVTSGWTTSRMSLVDLSLIRLALYEILAVDDIPPKVSVNEAVELARKYGGDDSPSFVNGILAKFMDRERK